MLKKFLLMLLLIGMPALAADNFLNSIVLSNEDNNISVILRSDSIASIKKDVKSQHELLITIKNTKQSPDISTLYNNINNVNALVIQNIGKDLIVYIDAPNIAKSNITFETPDSAPIPVSDTKNNEKFVWSILSILILASIILKVRITSKNELDEPNKLLKEREKELYKSFQKEAAALPSMNYKLKSYRKHVLKGETIRSYCSTGGKL